MLEYSAKIHQKLTEEISVLQQRIQELANKESDRKKAEETLRESQELYNKLIDTIPDIMVRMNLNGEIVFINDVGLRFGNYQITELIGKNMLSFISSEDRDRAVRNTALMFERRLGPREYHLITKDGSNVPFEVNGDILRNEDGSPYGLLHICRDITERKKAEKEKHRNQEIAKRLAEEMAIIAEIGRVIGSTLDIDEVYARFAAEVAKLIPFDRIHVNLKDPDGKSFTIAYVSGTDIAGRRPGDKVPLAGSLTAVLFRTRISMLLNPMSNEEIVRRFLSASAATAFRIGMRSIMAVPLISGDEVIGGLHFRTKKPNAYTEQDLHLAERIGAQIAGAIANAQLYSTLKETEKSLRKSEDRYRTLFNEARDGIALADRETGKILDCNRALCRMVEWTGEELIGETQSILHPQQALVDGQSLSYRRHRSENPGLVMEDILLSKTGKHIPVEIGAAQVSIGGRDCLFGIFRNITKRRQVEDALKETLDQLEVRVRERTIELEETNTALRVLIKKGDEAQRNLEESLPYNIHQLVTPFLSRLRVSQSNPERLMYLNILEENLNNIDFPVIHQLSAVYKNLTPKEILIAELVKQGKRSKEIAELFGIAIGTVITHRNNIRKKLDLKSRDANLRSH
jgi:PAS domain S-box-containing protein